MLEVISQFCASVYHNSTFLVSVMPMLPATLAMTDCLMHPVADRRVLFFSSRSQCQTTLSSEFPAFQAIESACSDPQIQTLESPRICSIISQEPSCNPVLMVQQLIIPALQSIQSTVQSPHLNDLIS